MASTRWTRKDLLAGIVICLLPGPAESQAPCAGATDQTVTAVTVYAAPPTFSTGSGWNLAPILTTLPKDSTVRVCERRTVGFFGSHRPWVRVQHEAASGMVDGWISASGTLKGSKKLGGEPSSLRFPSPWVSTAQAQEPGGMDAEVPSTTPFLVMVFVSILLGMAMKGLFDHLSDESLKAKGYWRDTIKAFIVSPIVFLGFATGGNFQLTSGLSLFVFLCMSFQNGFFWQTILAKAGPTVPQPAKSSAASS